MSENLHDLLWFQLHIFDASQYTCMIYRPNDATILSKNIFYDMVYVNINWNYCLNVKAVYCNWATSMKYPGFVYSTRWSLLCK